MVMNIPLAAYCVTDLVSLKAVVAMIKSSGGKSLNVTPEQWVFFDKFARGHLMWTSAAKINAKLGSNAIIVPLLDGVPIMIIGADGELY